MQVLLKFGGIVEFYKGGLAFGRSNMQGVCNAVTTVNRYVINQGKGLPV